MPRSSIVYRICTTLPCLLIVALLAAGAAAEEAPAEAGPPERERTRPLCAFPQVATYKGSGSTDEAANFVCK